MDSTGISLVACGVSIKLSFHSGAPKTSSFSVGRLGIAHKTPQEVNEVSSLRSTYNSSGLLVELIILSLGAVAFYFILPQIIVTF